MVGWIWPSSAACQPPDVFWELADWPPVLLENIHTHLFT